MNNSSRRRAVHTQRSLEHLRKLGYLATVVERWDPHAIRADGGQGCRKDFLGIIDIIALRPGEILGVQSGSVGNRSEHRSKILAERKTVDWILSGSRLVIQSWKRNEVPTSSRNARNETKVRWSVVEDEILPIHLNLSAERIARAVIERFNDPSPAV